ncbi:unnamed protein product [Closterium sp. NIES-53]
MMPQAQRISQQRQEVRGRHNGRQNGLQRHCALDLLVLLLLVASRSPAVVSSAAAAAPAAAAAGGETREKAAEASVPPLKESDPLERASAAAVKSSHFETPDIALLRNMSGISTSTGGLYETKGIHGTRGNEAKGNLDIRGIRPTRRAHHSKAIHHNHTTKGAFHTGTGKYEQRLSRKRPRGWPAMKKRPHGRACIRKMSRGSGHRARATSSSESILPLQKIQRGRGKCGKGQRGRDKGESGRGRRKNKISMGKRDRRVGSGDKSSAKPPAPITPGQKKPPASRTPGQKPPGLKPLAPVTPGQKPPVPDTPTTKTPGQAPPAGSRSHTSPDSPGGSPDHHVSMRSNQGGPQQAATGSSSNTSVTQQADKATALAPIPAVAPVPAVAPSCGGNSAGFLTTTAAATSPAAPPAAPPQPPKPKYFIEMGKIRVSGIHTALTHYKTILYIDRTDVSNTYAKLLNGRTAYAEEYSFETNSLRALDVKSNVFCSAGAIDAYGRLISIGGTSDANATNLADPLLDGAASIRSFSPCPQPSATAATTAAPTTAAASAIDAYGRLISIGGTSDANATNLADPLLDGSASIRSFTPCPPATAAPAAAATAAAASGGTANGGANNTSSASSSSSGSASGNSSSSGGCDFSLVGQMTSKRWYPTAQLLPDGRIFIVGGANVFGNLAINSVQNNNPTFEFWPRKEGEGNYKLRFLEETLPYNLYPFVHLLPSGHLFIFAGQRAILLNYTTNTVYRTLPPLDVSRFGPANTNIFRSYPVTGSSAMLQLSSADGYTPRILICGGSSSAADLTNRDNRTGACLGCAAPATATCGLISPMDPNPKWTYEIMPVARVMPDAVLLLDGTVLICNGGRRGFQGLKQSYAGGDVRTPVIYTPTNPPGKRFWQVPESSRYARMYHSSALLLWDGSVLISGSNPNDRLTTRGTYPTQFAVDRFAPPYLQWGVLRNVLWKVPTTITLNTLFSVRLNTTVATPSSLDRFRAVLVHPGFSTHSQRMGMRNVLLDISAVWISPDNQTGGYRDSNGAWVPGKWEIAVLPAAAAMASLGACAFRFARRFVVFSLVLASLACFGQATEDLVIVRVDRKIDLQTHLVRNSATLKVENAGSTPVSSVTLALLVPPPGRLAFATAVLLQGKAKSRTFQELPLTSTTPESPVENAIYFKAQLPAPLEPGKTAQIECYFVVINALTPHPAEISQADPQLVIFRDSHYFTSPYPVRSQSTVLRLPSHQIESFTPLEPSKKADSEIKLGPYEGVDAGEVSALAVHYENNRPFPLFERAEREYEISHWGNVYVTEDYHLVHSGAKHTGMFSRLDYQHRPMAIGVSSLRGLMAVLPERAHTVYYRDEIGNISSSHLRYPPRKAELEIEPRYPLLGGWSVTFRVGYSVPLGDLVSISTDGTRVLNATLGSPFADVPVKHLTVKVRAWEGKQGGKNRAGGAGVWLQSRETRDQEQQGRGGSRGGGVGRVGDGTRMLNATLGSPFADVPVKHLTVKVVLPEGSYGISADVPFPVGKSTETKYSYLDTVGRPVVVLDKRDVVPEQGIMHFQVKYKFSKVALLTEPLLLILFFFLLFLLFIAYTHSDLTISKTAPAYLAKLHHEEFLDLIQRLSRLVADRAAQIESLDAGLLKLGRSGDVAGAKAGRRNVETELKESGREIAAVVGKIEALSKVPAGPLRTVLTLVAKDKERAERAVAKHTVAVEAYEKKTPAKEIDAKIGPMQQRLAALKAEIKELVMALEE